MQKKQTPLTTYHYFVMDLRTQLVRYSSPHAGGEDGAKMEVQHAAQVDHSLSSSLRALRLWALTSPSGSFSADALAS